MADKGKLTQTVQNLYAAFQRGDVPGILEHCAENIDWRHDQLASRECPWNGNFSGRKNLPGFFAALGEHIDFKVFEPKAFLETGNQVAVHLRIESVLRKNGKPLQNDSIHLWTFDTSGRVASYRHFNDTAAELAAWRG